MPDASNKGKTFIEQAEAIFLEHLSDENFGVSELAGAMHMSRSNLLRKVKKETRLSASQFIRQIRLKQAMDLLRQTSMTVSEVSYGVGFGSTSYFIKCFREYYGHPPGEVGKREAEESTSEQAVKNAIRWPIVVAIAAAMGVLIFLFFYKKEASPDLAGLEKSIAVLPFKNESSDSSNLYFVNGLMESTLSSLQKIEDLRVISRTSVEQYRSTEKSIPEMAEELHVSYFVDGSGQKVGDRVLLNIRLVEAAGDRTIWAEQYSRELGDVFELQNEVARKIADAIEAIVTPAELEQIAKPPTDNLVAYDYYLQALDYFHVRSREGLEKAIPLFEKAVSEDPTFALAYADIAISYYFLDIFQANKQYTEQINTNADKALLHDPKLAESLLAKAFYYMHIGEYRLAVPHLEKALEYNPNASGVVQTLSDLYARLIPDTSKYLEYALRGMQLEVAPGDSVQLSYLNLHLSNALIQNGFAEEALDYINRSLAYNPNNEYAPYLRVYILYALDGDLEETQELMTREWRKDTTRVDILQEVAKLHYFREQYDSAYYYYDKYVKAVDLYGLNIYPQEDIKIGWVFEQMGKEEEAARFYSAYDAYCQRDESIYKAASLAVKYAREGAYDEAIRQLKEFAAQENYQYWILLFMDKDPIMKSLEDHPEYAGIIRDIKEGFRERQAKLRASLKEKELL